MSQVTEAGGPQSNTPPTHTHTQNLAVLSPHYESELSPNDSKHAEIEGVRVVTNEKWGTEQHCPDLINMEDPIWIIVFEHFSNLSKSQLQSILGKSVCWKFSLTVIALMWNTMFNQMASSGALIQLLHDASFQTGNHTSKYQRVRNENEPEKRFHCMQSIRCL